jgi:hypothetical protein
MTDTQPRKEDWRPFWQTSGLLGVIVAVIGIIGTLIAILLQQGGDGSADHPTTTSSGGAISKGGWVPPALDPPAPGLSRYARVDIQPNDGGLGLGERVLYRGYLVGYEEGWVVVHARIGSWTGNYTIGKVSPDAKGYWEIPRETFGKTGAGSTVGVRLVVPLDQRASEWLFQNYRHRNNSDWPRDDATFNGLNIDIVHEIQATRMR